MPLRCPSSMQDACHLPSHVDGGGEPRHRFVRPARQLSPPSTNSDEDRLLPPWEPSRTVSGGVSATVNGWLLVTLDDGPRTVCRDRRRLGATVIARDLPRVPVNKPLSRNILGRRGPRPSTAHARCSGRRQPCGGQRQCIAFDYQPTLGDCVITGHLEVRHLPIADLGCFGKNV
jgi:hypothetical protein